MTASATGMPNFCTLSGLTFSIKDPPYSLANGLSYTVVVKISDGAETATSSFKIIIKNLPPSYYPLPTTWQIYGGS